MNKKSGDLRKYIVTFRDLKTGNERKTQIETADCINAARLTYAIYGRKEIEVLSTRFIGTKETKKHGENLHNKNTPIANAEAENEIYTQD